MEINEIINNELDSIGKLDAILPRSLVFFDIPNEIISDLYKNTEKIFLATKQALLYKRMMELNNIMFPFDDLVGNKYQNLQERYKDVSEKKKQLYEWQEDAFKSEYNQAASIDTKIKNLLDRMELIQFDVRKFYETRQEISLKRKEVNTSNLDRYYGDPEFRKYYKRTEGEIEFENLYNYMHERIIARYAFLFNIVEPLDDKYNLEYLFSPINNGEIIWSIILFNESFLQWRDKYPESLQISFLTNKLLFSYNNNDVSLIEINK